jgi:hypothetical protein
MFIGKPTKAQYWFFAFLSFAMSALMIHSWATFKGIPPRSHLRPASGPVDWVQDGKYGIKFGLRGVQQSFDYASKGNAMGLVYDTLSSPGRPVITVLYDPGSAGSPTFSKDVYYSVYEFSVAGRPFRSHAEIDRAWRSDEAVGGWLGVAFVAIGIFLCFCARRSRGAT